MHNQTYRVNIHTQSDEAIVSCASEKTPPKNFLGGVCVFSAKVAEARVDFFIPLQARWFQLQRARAVRPAYTNRNFLFLRLLSCQARHSRR